MKHTGVSKTNGEAKRIPERRVKMVALAGRRRRLLRKRRNELKASGVPGTKDAALSAVALTQAGDFHDPRDKDAAV